MGTSKRRRPLRGQTNGGGPIGGEASAAALSGEHERLWLDDKSLDLHGRHGHLCAGAWDIKQGFVALYMPQKEHL